MTEHYFSKNPQSEAHYGRLQMDVRDQHLDILTCSGLFSWKGLDLGTAVLIENMVIDDFDDVLDLGCGYGIIGIVASTLTNGNVLLSDVNERAAHVASKNVDELAIENAEVRQSDCFEAIPESFNTILTNPPYSAGLDTVRRMIEGSKEHLYPGGTLQLVGRHTKGGHRAEEHMLETFGNCEVLARESGFRVYMSRKEDKDECKELP